MPGDLAGSVGALVPTRLGGGLEFSCCICPVGVLSPMDFRRVGSSLSLILWWV